MESLAQLGRKEPRELQGHRESVETEASPDQGDIRERLGRRVLPESRAPTGTPASPEQVVCLDQQDLPAIQYVPVSTCTYTHIYLPYLTITLLA